MKTTTSSKATLPTRNAKTGRFEKATARHVTAAKPAAKGKKA